MLAIAVVTPLRAFAQTPPAPPAEAAPPPAAPPAAPPPAPPAPAPAPAPMAAPAPAPAPAAPAVPTPKMTWGGLVDAYYMYLFNKGNAVNSLSGATNIRQFDTNTNSATLSLAALSLNAAIDPVALQLDMGYGASGAIINSVSNSVGGQGNFIVLQAYGTITVLPQLTLDFGKFYTTAGAEVIPANKNWMYSRSILFFSIPLLHTGARANFKVNDQLTLQASLVNGWNNDPDNNAWKTVGLNAAITVNPMVSIFATTYFGKEGTQFDNTMMPPAPLPDTTGDLRFLGDLVVALTLNDKLGVNINADYVKGFDDVGSDYIVGVAGMVRYVISDHLNVAGRGEFVRSHFDATSTNADAMEGTVMAGIDVGKNFELRPEVRFDHLGQSHTFDSNGKSDQITGTLAALTWF
jgi:hypothetical protein